MFSRNASSSRAIPVQKMIDKVRDHPAYPIYWGRNEKGMQAHTELTPPEIRAAKLLWNRSRLFALDTARELAITGVHKQIVNRILEPFSWITVIISATQWSNFFELRCHPDAQPEIRHIAEMMREAINNSSPNALPVGHWHLPYISPEDFRDFGKVQDWKNISVARCARVSYLNHEGKKDIVDDVALAERLRSSGHWSPFEHVAQAIETPAPIGNFRGWKQYRKEFANECR